MIVLIVTLASAGADDVNQEKFLDFVMELAIDKKADCIQVRGRPGWVRWLKPQGFKPVYTLIEKAVAL